MALQHHIDQASYTQTRPMDTFTDAAIVPPTFAECAIPDEDLGLVLRTIHRTATDREDLAFLLDVVLGEG